MLVVLNEIVEVFVGSTCMGTNFMEDGPMMVALACERAAAKAPIIPVI